MSSTLPQTTWVIGTKNWSNTTYAQSYNYKSRVCHGCGTNTVQTGCIVNYVIPENEARHDWNFKQEGCWASTDVSTVSCLDYSVCPNLAGLQAQAQWGYNGDSDTSQWDVLASSRGPYINNSNNQSTNIDCIYPLSSFINYDAVNAFKTEFPEQVDDDKSDYNTKILPFFCMAQSDDCPVSIVTGLPMQKCSRFIANGEEGAICRAWSGYSNAGEPLCDNQTTKTDTYLYQYCSVYNTEDCMCINRLSNPVFQVMSVGNPAAVNYPTCWWQPCTDKTTSLVPTDLLCCPPNQDTVICNSVNIVLGGNSTGLSFDPTTYTTCGVDPNDNDTSGTTWSIYWWIIIIVVIVVTIGIALLVLLL